MQVRGLVDVLLTISQQRGTGILTVQSSDEIVGITFRNGEIVSADAMNQSMEEGLGKLLVERQLVLPEELASVLSEHESGGGRVRDLLVDRHYLERSQLLEVLRSHAYVLSCQVLSWPSGEFKFYRVEEVSFEQGIRSLGVEELLVRAAEELGSEGPLPGSLPEPESVFEVLEGGGRPTTKRPDLPFEPQLEEGGEALGLLEWVDGQRSAAELSIESGIPQYRVLFNLYLLQQAGRIQVVGGGEPEFLPTAPAAEDEIEAPIADVTPPAAPASDGWLTRLAPDADRLQAAVARWKWSLTRGLGLALAAALVTLLLVDPGRFLLPYPWQGGLRQALLEEQASAAYAKIDRAAKTFFLLEGRFPEQLSTLVTQGFLVDQDLLEPAGRPLGYSAQIASYLIYPLGEGDPVPASSRTELITGNFLLDPEIVSAQATPVPPLVLLD
jgi:hypothetical protein